MPTTIPAIALVDMLLIDDCKVDSGALVGLGVAARDADGIEDTLGACDGERDTDGADVVATDGDNVGALDKSLDGALVGRLLDEGEQVGLRDTVG